MECLMQSCSAEWIAKGCRGNTMSRSSCVAQERPDMTAGLQGKAAVNTRGPKDNTESLQKHEQTGLLCNK